ncbi:extensin family protein [Croceicoccus ponticola]|uniref:Extensin family protein n=1 Tax=Croceicoccus ponticola TaxID=2217664 RepID=A0A437GV51_9SPHN|nr:extensin family protein [Croceicoccus ponticola]RVQ65527.1 extensin family protein [Croceicoccus ponticola]
MSNRIRAIPFPRLPRIGTIAAGLGAVALLSACASDKPAPARPTTGTAPVARPATSAEYQMCRRELTEQGADFVALDDLLTGGGCSSTNAVALYHLVGDTSRFTVTNVDRIGCPLSQTVASWARYGVDRAARQMLGSGLVKIETFGSYSCRNVAGSTRRSAHSNANALDIAAFVLADGRRISVKDGWDNGTEIERRFLRVVQGSACKRFGTVLGPDYNAAHNDHFHVEMGDGSFCR